MYSTNPVSNADPAWVATHFVSKYYDVLANHPEYLHRFYKGDSMLSVNDMLDEGSAPRTAAVLTEIQELVNKTVAGARATTKHVDAQFSVHGGVLLHVSGVFSLKGTERAFEQTFFLATQENGFYVHNDLLRVYAHSTVAVSSNGNHQPAPVPAQLAAPAVHAEPAPVAVAEPVKPAPPAPRSQAAPQPPAPPPAQTQPAEPAPAASTPVRSAPQPEQPAPAPSPTPTNTTWAALVKHPQPQKDAAKPAAPSPAPHTGSKDTVHALPDSTGPQSNGNTHHAPSTAGPQHTHEGSVQPQVHCIIVRNLPQEHLPQELLEQEFEKFGKLRKGGAAITIHNVGRDVGKVAYIKFEDASAVEAALQASVTILDKSVEIQRHEGPLPSYGRGSGGRGMGGGFRGGRSGPPPPGRGPYGDNTGRGGGRGGVDRMTRTDRRPSGGPGGPLGAVGPGGGRGGLQGRGGRGPSRREDSGPQDKE